MEFDMIDAGLAALFSLIVIGLVWRGPIQSEHITWQIKLILSLIVPPVNYLVVSYMRNK